MLKLISDPNEIENLQEKFEKALMSILKRQERLPIGHQGGIVYNLVNYNNYMWFSTGILNETKVSIPRYWNAFGLGGKRKEGNQIITVEINQPFNGKSKQLGGLFARDEKTNTVFLLHRGKIGGGRKGIGKEAFKEWYRGKWVDVYDGFGNKEEAILIGSINSKGLVHKIYDFIKEVDQFKREVTEGDNKRKAIELEESLTFDPEFQGKKKGRRRSEFEYESFHGTVVNALAEKLLTRLSKGETVFNDKNIDLGLRKNHKTHHIYEIKTNTDKQSIYTGIGQLLFHSAGNNTVKKTLVIPEIETSFDKLFSILSALDVDIIQYNINEHHRVDFLEF